MSRRRKERERDAVIELPEVVTEACLFDAAPGPQLTFDFRRVRVLHIESLEGLMRQARRQPVRMIAKGGSHADRTLIRAFGPFKLETLGFLMPDEWHMQLDLRKGAPRV